VGAVGRRQGRTQFVKPEGFDDMHRRNGIQHRLNANEAKWQRFHMGDRLHADEGKPSVARIKPRSSNGHGKMAVRNGHNGNGHKRAKGS